MRKYTILLVVLICMFFSLSCAKQQEDIWDGSIADNFESGDGSKASPFVIKTGEQFALMAKKINSGEYTDAHFSLESSIDLNGIEWTPIGIYENPFCGHFDANNNTVKGLKMTTAMVSEYFISPYKDMNYAGLFGALENATIKNIEIKDSSISCKTIPCDYEIYMISPDETETNTIIIGTLCAYTVGEKCEISNVKISDSKLQVFSDAPGNGYMAIGGVVGFHDAGGKMERISSDVDIDLSTTSLGTVLAGGIAGFVTKELDCLNIANYSTVRFGHVYHFAGLFGAVHVKTGLKIKNIYSELTINVEDIDPYFVPNTAFVTPLPCNVNIISGYLMCEYLELENVYGRVVVCEEDTAESKSIYRMFDYDRLMKETKQMPFVPDIKEINAVPCDKLPKKHGLDEDIWDTSNKKHPTLK